MNASPPPATTGAKQEIDQIVEARWIVPVEPADTVLENHCLAIHDGRILALLPTDEASRRFAAQQHFRLGEHLLLPGFVNLHTHAAMTLLRGYADDMSLSILGFSSSSD